MATTLICFIQPARIAGISGFTSVIKHCQRAQRTQGIELITWVNLSARIVTCIGSKVVHQIESLSLFMLIVIKIEEDLMLTFHDVAIFFQECFVGLRMSDWYHSIIVIHTWLSLMFSIKIFLKKYLSLPYVLGGGFLSFWSAILLHRLQNRCSIRFSSPSCSSLDSSWDIFTTNIYITTIPCTSLNIMHLWCRF